MLIRLSEHMKVVRALTTPHQGVVVDNEDPEKLGRVKCTIPQIMEGDADSLPWIFSELDPSHFEVPEVGDVLKIEFPFGDVYTPVVTGYWHTEENHNTDFDDDYPNAFGLVKQGFKMIYRKVAKTGVIEHPTGTKVEINDQGSITWTIVKDIIQNITGAWTLAVDGAASLTAKGNLTLSSDGNANITGKGGLNATSDGSAVFSGKGSTTVGDGSSSTNVDGSVVLLAGGGAPVAVLGSQAVGIGNLGAPVTCTIINGSSKVLAAN